MCIWILNTIGNPWDYLNGTEYGFGIDAGNANQVIVAVYNLFYAGTGTLAIVLIMSALVAMLFASSPQERAQGKDSLIKRFMILFILGCAAGFLTFLMMILNKIFGIA